MNEVLLTDVIKKTREAVQSFGYSQSTMRHYERYWKNLSSYFAGFGCETFSEQLAEQYISNMKQQLDSGKMSRSKYKLVRRAVCLLKEGVTDGKSYGDAFRLEF